MNEEIIKAKLQKYNVTDAAIEQARIDVDWKGLLNERRELNDIR